MQSFLDAILAFFAGLDMSQWLSVGSAIAAIGAFLLNRATVKRQERMQYEALRRQRDSELTAWAGEVIERLADAHRLVRERRDGAMTDQDFYLQRSEMRARISALLDRGRLFFPNALVDGVDESGKEDAFRGKRQPVLNALNRCYRVVSDMGKDGDYDLSEGVRRIVSERRLFVSEVFKEIDPRRRREAMSALESA